MASNSRDTPGSPSSSMDSTGDTSRLLKELMDLQKSNVSSIASIDRSINLQESQEDIQTLPGLTQKSEGGGMEPTLTELMKTMYDGDGSATRQLITLQGNDTVNSFSVFGQEVDIVSSKQAKSQSLTGSTGSNKVKITPVVNYDWEPRRYVGNLVAVHRNNVFVAYVLKGRSGGVVRITNRHTAERHLLRDFVGRVIDLAFAHTDDVILAVVDEIGNLGVYEIKQADDTKIFSTILLKVNRPGTTLVSDYHRVIWCPYIPDDADDSSATDVSSQDGASRILVLTNDEKAEVWSVDLASKEYGCGPHYPVDVEVGLVQVDSHSKPIMDAAFSPDGTALATASIDGEVKFFQIYLSEESSSPRCLHKWKPHGGKPMSCLFFLDNHKNFTQDTQFWKFAVTGANNNQEIKIWSCESWKCLQTIRFLCPPGLPSNFSIEPVMKAGLDLSARYLVLTDIKRNVMYVLMIHHSVAENTVHVSSVSEFTLAQPCLSFAILDAGTKKLKKSKGDDSHLDEITTGEIDREEGDEEERKMETSTSRIGVQIKLYTVHPKALQELLIRFKPELSVPQPSAPSVSSVSQSEAGMMDGLSDISMSVEGNGDAIERNEFLLPETGSGGQPLLMTPEAFTASPRKQYADDSVNDGIHGSASSTSSFTQVSAMNEDFTQVSAMNEDFTQASGMNEDFLSPRSSSNSTITQLTPTTPKRDSPSETGNNVTPSSIPLPPVTSSEESELTTPGTAGSRELKIAEMSSTPQSSKDVEDFFAQSGSIKRDNLQQVSLDSTESTGLFDVSDIPHMSALSRSHQKTQSSYDEMDEEVAEVLGDTQGEYAAAQSTGTQPFDEREEEGLQSMENSDSSLRSWPKPPDVGTEAKRLAEEAVKDSIQDGSGNGTSDVNETVDDDAEEEEDDEDVVVEEEEVEGGDGGEDTGKDEEEEIEEDIEEEEEVEEDQDIEESIDDKTGPQVAPVAGAGFTTTPREIRPVEVREIHKETVREVFDQKQLQKLHTSISSIVEAMEQQQQQLNQLRRDIAEQQENNLELQRRHLEQEQLRSEVSQGPQPSIEEHLGKLENIVTSRVERLFNQHSQREHQRTQELMRQSEARDQQRQERLFSSVTQTLTSTVASNLEKSLHNVVVPSVTKVLDPVRDQIRQDMAQKLVATDSLLKDNIGKMVRSRQTVEAIGTAAASALHTPMQAAYRESFQNVVIPAFERATQNMYQQVADTFQKGTKEYSRQLETHLENIRQKHLEARDPVVAEMRKLTDTFQKSAEQMKSHVLATVQSQLSSQLNSFVTSAKENLTTTIRDTVRTEVASAMQEHSSTFSNDVISAMRSRAVTPADLRPENHVDKSQIMNLLRQGQLNTAFQQALSAANLELLMAVCEAVNPSQVFNQSPCPLQQPVLLSLVQQLSADLDNYTELKHKYIEEAVMNLDPHNGLTHQHLKGVLYGLNQKLRVYIAAHPNDKATRSLRMLLMASESLIK